MLACSDPVMTPPLIEVALLGVGLLLRNVFIAVVRLKLELLRRPLLILGFPPPPGPEAAVVVWLPFFELYTPPLDCPSFSDL